jgi:hypothetical protein
MRRFGPLVLVSGVLAVLALTGCGGKSETPTPTAAADDQVLLQYRRLWTETLPAATIAPTGTRRDILARTMTDPALNDAIGRIAKMDEAGQTSYGVTIPLRQSVKLDGKSAVVTGCLDSSKSGVADAKSGRKLTVGVPTSPVAVTFKQGADGVWRVSETKFPTSQKC